jgi:hypothetical protein
MLTNKRFSEFSSPVSVDTLVLGRTCEWCLEPGPTRWHYTVGGTYHNEQPLLCNECSQRYKKIVERDARELSLRVDTSFLQAAS